MTDWTPPNTEYPPPKPGEPPLHRAARLGDAAEIRTLAAGGADPNALFDIGLDPGAHARRATPLMVAAGSGDGADVGTVRTLLELGADSTLEVDGASAAVLACEGLGWNYRPGGDVERLRALLDAGAELPTDPARANRLVCEAAGTGDPARLRTLLERGLGPHPHFDPDEARRRSAALWEDIARHGAEQPDPFADLPDELRESLAETMRETNEQMAERFASGPLMYEIPLHRAAESGSAECVRLLLAAGADPLVRDNAKRTAMYAAASRDVVDALVAAGAPLEDADEYEWSPLVGAINDGVDALPRIRALVEAGADVNATHDRGYTVFMSAVGSNRHIEILRLLIEAGADPRAVTDLGYNAFHAAIDVNGEANAEESVRETLALLKELGVDVERRDTHGRTPLVRAIHEGTEVEVRVLCEIGADPNAACPYWECGAESCDSVDLPPLLHAERGHGVHREQKIQALLKAGAIRP